MRRKDREIFREDIEKIFERGENSSLCPDVCFVVVGDTEVEPEKFSTLYESVILIGRMKMAKDKKESLTALLEKYSREFMLVL